MKKWIWRAVIIAIIGFVGYGAYDYYQADLHTRPEMPEGAFSISYKNGLRAILVDVPNEEESRRYFGIPQEVPYYLEKAWTFAGRQWRTRSSSLGCSSNPGSCQENASKLCASSRSMTMLSCAD